jgi:hypothetical protein
MTKYRVYTPDAIIIDCEEITIEGPVTWCGNTGYINTPLRIERTVEPAPPMETGQSSEPAKCTQSPKSRQWFQGFINWIDAHQG